MNRSVVSKVPVIILRVGLTCLLWLTLSIAAWAQSDNAVISGFVKDSTGAVVTGAKVTITSETRAFERTGMTNNEGYYVISSLPPGIYTLTVEAQGFKAYKETGRKLDPNLTTS